MTQPYTREEGRGVKLQHFPVGLNFLFVVAILMKAQTGLKHFEAKKEHPGGPREGREEEHLKVGKTLLKRE